MTLTYEKDVLETYPGDIRTTAEKQRDALLVVLKDLIATSAGAKIMHDVESLFEARNAAAKAVYAVESGKVPT